MRILLLTAKPPWPEHDGGAVASSRIITGLASNGAEIYLLSLTTPKHPGINSDKISKEEQVKYYNEVFADTTIRLIPLLKNLLFSEKPYDLQRFYSASFLEQIREACSSVSFDIIQCEGLLFSLYIKELRQFTNASIVLRAHNIEYQIRVLMAQREKNIIKKWYLRGLASRIKKQEVLSRKLFDAVVPISEPDTEWFKSLEGNAPVFTSATGIETVTLQTHNDPLGFKVGFIGSLDWQPNIDGLVWFINDVWPAVINAIPGASLNIAGRNADIKTRKKLSGPNIYFRGEIDDALRFTSSMNVMIAPLFSGSGMRIKIIESMSAGIPVVASPIAASGLPVTSGKDIILASDIEEFSTGLIELLKNDQKAKKIALEAGKTIKNNFDNTILTTRLFDFYKTLINGC
jgi:polysaccharide biosynthesis protein PslH